MASSQLRTDGGISSRAAVNLSSFYFFYFSFLGCLLPFWPIYLDSLGFSGYELGLANAIFLGTKVFSPTIAGILSDKTGYRITIIRCGILGAGISFSLFLLDFNLVEMLIISAAYSVFWNAILSQFEAYTLESLNNQASRYSRIRLWGSIGFIFFALGLGVFFEYASLAFLPMIMISIVILALFVSFRLPELSYRHEEGRNKNRSIIPLLRQKEVIGFLLICFFMQLSHGPYYSFYSLYMQEQGIGSGYIGLLWAIGVVSEVCLFLIFPSWVSKTGPYFLLNLSMALSLVRWLLVALFPEQVVLVVIAQLLHAFSFGCLHVVSMMYVQRFFSREFSGRGQALYSGVSFGLGGAAGAVMSGYLWELYSHSLLFLVAACSVFVAILISKFMLSK